MPRKYTHMKVLEDEILSLKAAGKTHREVGEELGLSQKQIKKFIERHNRRQKKVAAGIKLRPKGRPRQGERISEAEKDYEIKRLKMENELLRDFLRLAGRR